MAVSSQAITQQKDLALLGQPTVLFEAIQTAAAIVPLSEIEAAEEELSTLTVETDEDSRRATALAGKFSGWSSRISDYWKGLGKPYYERYKMFGRAASDGVVISGDTPVTIVGSTRLDNGKLAAESKNREFLRQQKERDRKRQESLNKAVESDVKSLNDRIADAADNGDMATARELIAERDMVANVPVIMTQKPDIGDAAQGTKVEWSLVPKTGLMDLIKAVADGTVPLYHEVTVKGETEMRALFDLSSVVANQNVRAMGMNLNWPGIVTKEDVSLRTRKS